MVLTKEQIQNGFWSHHRERSFPPEAITYPDEYEGSTRLNIVCTQLEISSYQQRKLVDQWCQLLPTLHNIHFLWFSCRVNQAMLDAASQIFSIEGLYLKWGGIKDLSALKGMEKLKFFHLGSSPSVESIQVFQEMTQLIVLHLENIKKIRDLSPLSRLTQLEGLAVEGSTWTTQVVDTLEPLTTLPSLRYIFLANLRTMDQTLLPLAKIKTLRNIRSTFNWPKSEFETLRDSLPELKYGTPFQTDLIDLFAK